MAGSGIDADVPTRPGATTMLAMVLDAAGRPLRPERRLVPAPGRGEVLLRVLACAVCRTDLHVVDGDLQDPKLPLVPGHEIVGEVVQVGPEVSQVAAGQRVGVPWLGWTCGRCDYCRRDQENLCPHARFTGYHLDGGYAEYAVADARYCFELDATARPEAEAPLLCAGLIGYRSLALAGEGDRLGLYGFGAAAHIVVQLASHQGRRVFAFTRPGDEQAQAFAMRLGACWAGSSELAPPEELDCAIIFAPVGSLVPAALRAVRPGGTVVCGGIHMSEIPAFPYDWLWREKRLLSVANLTRRDGEEFLALAPRVPITTETQCFPLSEANLALSRLREGALTGAAVLLPGWVPDGPRPA